jgi:hypothetical protein
MTHVTVNEGETVELPCVASSNPLPKYRWSLHNKELIIDSVSKIQRAGNLMIVDAKVTDSGVYTCNSSNSHGSATGTTDLTVQCKGLSGNTYHKKTIIDFLCFDVCWICAVDSTWFLLIVQFSS